MPFSRAGQVSRGPHCWRFYTTRDCRPGSTRPGPSCPKPRRSLRVAGRSGAPEPDGGCDGSRGDERDETPAGKARARRPRHIPSRFAVRWGVPTMSIGTRSRPHRIDRTGSPPRDSGSPVWSRPAPALRCSAARDPTRSPRGKSGRLPLGPPFPTRPLSGGGCPRSASGNTLPRRPRSQGRPDDLLGPRAECHHPRGTGSLPGRSHEPVLNAGSPP